jgi:hypothetical protein
MMPQALLDPPGENEARILQPTKELQPVGAIFPFRNCFAYSLQTLYRISFAHASIAMNEK